VQLREEEVRYVVESALPGISRDVTDGEIASPPSVSELAESAVYSAATIRDPGSDIVETLKQVVEKTKALAGVVDKAARVCATCFSSVPRAKFGCLTSFTFMQALLGTL
jgi:hypothetical protein